MSLEEREKRLREELIDELICLEGELKSFGEELSTVMKPFGGELLSRPVERIQTKTQSALRTLKSL